jgi:hypothetical protein
VASGLLGSGPEADVKHTGTASDLRYLDAHSVRCPAGNLADLDVCTEDAQPLGTVNGVLISPSTRQLRYYVIGKSGLFSRRTYLLSVEEGAVLQPDRKTLRIPARMDQLELTSFSPRSVPECSDDDLISAMFASTGPA